MKLFRRQQQQQQQQTDNRQNSGHDSPIWSNPFEDGTNGSPLMSVRADQQLARKCPICLESYRPANLDMERLEAHESMDGAARVVHTRHSSISSTASNVTQIAEDSDTARMSRRSSRFHEHFSRDATSDRTESNQQVAVCEPDALVLDSSLLAVSGEAAQRRRRRSAQSCGSDEQALSIGTAWPRRQSNPSDRDSQQEYYHLNGIRMIF